MLPRYSFKKGDAGLLEVRGKQYFILWDSKQLYQSSSCHKMAAS